MSKMLTVLMLLSVFGMAGCLSGPGSIFYADQKTGTINIDQEAFKQKTEARLEEFERRLEVLRSQASDAREEVRTSLRLEIDELHRKNVAARQRLAEMWRNRTDKWEEERMHMEAALDDLRVGFERAFSHAP